MQDRERGVEQRIACVVVRRRDAEQPRRAPRRAGKQLRPLHRRCRDQRCFEQLAHKAVGEVPLEL